MAKTWLQGFVNNMLEAEQVGQLAELNKHMSEQQSTIADLQKKLHVSEQKQTPDVSSRNRQHNRIPSTPKNHNWLGQDHQDRLLKILEDFRSHHENMDPESEQFTHAYPEKAEALRILNQLQRQRYVTPDEYIIVFREIYNF